MEDDENGIPVSVYKMPKMAVGYAPAINTAESGARPKAEVRATQNLKPKKVLKNKKSSPSNMLKPMQLKLRCRTTWMLHNLKSTKPRPLLHLLKRHLS